MNRTKLVIVVSFSFFILSNFTFAAPNNLNSADINNSGNVDFQDLIALFQNWGDRPSNPNSDLDGNGRVDFQDLIVLFQNWGEKRKNENNFTNSNGNPSSVSAGNFNFLEGTLVRRIADDFDNKKATIDYFLQTPNGKRYNISDLAGVSNIADGSILKIAPTGRATTVQMNGTKVIGNNRIETIRPPLTSTQDSMGNRKVAVILANYNDDNRQPWTKQEVADFLFNNSDSANNFFKEVSYNQTSLSGEVFGWYNVVTNEFCWDDEEVLRVADKDIDYSLFDEVIVIMPEINCGFGGFGHLSKISVPSNDNGGNLSIYFAKINGYNGSQKSKFVVAHEIGHTYGLSHAGGVWCVSKQYNNLSRCISEEQQKLAEKNPNVNFDPEYANTYDTMGYALTPMHFNAAYKDKLGWLDRVPLIKKSGIYLIRPLEIPLPPRLETRPTSFPAAYKIPNINFYLEYRWPVGFDNKSALIKNGPGLIINMFSDSTSYSYALSNGSSDLNSDPFEEYVRYIVKPNESFYDASRNMTITPLTSDLPSKFLPVSVSFDNCLPNAFKILENDQESAINILTTGDSQTVSAQQQLFRIINNDSLACGSTRFILKAELVGAPAGTTIAFSGRGVVGNEFTLEPFQEKGINVNVEIPTNRETTFTLSVSVARKIEDQPPIYIPVKTAEIRVVRKNNIAIDPAFTSPVKLIKTVQSTTALKFKISRENSIFNERILNFTASGLPASLMDGVTLYVNGQSLSSNMDFVKQGNKTKVWDISEKLIPAGGSTEVEIKFTPNYSISEKTYSFSVLIETDISKYDLTTRPMTVVDIPPPDRPVNYSPANGSIVSSRSAVKLIASPMSSIVKRKKSPSATQWRIMDLLTGKIVYDSGEVFVVNPNQYNAHYVPLNILKPFKLYTWQARYNYYGWSEWSAPTVFRTSF